MMWSRIGRLAIGTIGLGMLGAASWIRSPNPPQNRTTFMALCRLGRVLPAQPLVQGATLKQLLQAREPRVGVEAVDGEPDGPERREQLERAIPRRPDGLRRRQRGGQLGAVDAVAPRVGPRFLRVLDSAARERLVDDLRELADAVVLGVRADVERLVCDPLRPRDDGGRGGADDV